MIPLLLTKPFRILFPWFNFPMAHLQKPTEKLCKCIFVSVSCEPFRIEATHLQIVRTNRELNVQWFVVCVAEGLTTLHKSHQEKKSLPLTSCNNTTTTKRNQVVYHYSSQLTNTKLNRVTSQTSSSPLRKKGRSHTQLQQQQPIPFEIFVKYHQQQTKQPINYSFINLNQQTNKQRKEQETWVFQDFSNGSQRDIPARLHQSMTPRCPRSITYTWT